MTLSVSLANGVVKDVVKDSSGKRQQTLLVVSLKISGKKKRYSTKLYNIRIAEPEEKHSSSNDDQVTAVAQITSPNL